MKVLFINNHGGGFADYIDVAPQTTVAQLFAQRLPQCEAADYLIRVNRLPVSADQQLQEGDRVRQRSRHARIRIICAHLVSFCPCWGIGG